MYHVIVKRIARKNFERVNQRDFASLLKDCVPKIYHRFGGTHALGGERHNREALGRWLNRLARLAPDMKLKVRCSRFLDQSEVEILTVEASRAWFAGLKNLLA